MPQKPLDVMRQQPIICPKYNSDDSENYVSIIEMTIKQVIIKCMMYTLNKTINRRTREPLTHVLQISSLAVDQKSLNRYQ